MRSRRPALTAGLIAAATVLPAGCAPTTYDAAEAPVSVAVTSTTVPTGTATELLPRLRDETAALVGVLQAKGDAAAEAKRIRALWQAARTEVTSADVHLADSFEATVELAEKAAARQQLGYAIKASRNMAALVAAYR